MLLLMCVCVLLARENLRQGRASNKEAASVSRERRRGRRCRGTFAILFAVFECSRHEEAKLFALFRRTLAHQTSPAMCLHADSEFGLPSPFLPLSLCRAVSVSPPTAPCRAPGSA